MAGMFDQGTKPTWYQPYQSQFEAYTGGPKIDVRGMQEARDATTGAAYNPTDYKPTTFQTFGGMKNPGSYGTSSDADIGNVFAKSMNTAIRPLAAQSQERMRQVNQGFGGGRMSGAAGKELALKNSQAYGSDISNVASGIGSSMSGKMLGQQETARAADYETKKAIEQQKFDEQKEVQKQQAAENFLAAGFSDAQAKYMADFAMSKANSMWGQAGDWLGAQNKMYEQMIKPYSDQYASLAQQGAIG